jgi:hypothetical protein
MRYNFSGGDPLTGKAAAIMLRSQYAQELLESSDEFNKGIVILVRTDEGGEEVKKRTTVVEDITSPEQLIEFVANNLEKVYQRPDAALKFANERGYEFPNIDLNKNKEQ